MKKQLVVLAAMLMAATPALAFVKNSAHDIPTRYATGTSTEICVYCHTPHGAATTGPLWNRNASGSFPANVYTSGTLNATMPANYNATDAALCMSCHDGATAMNSVVNPPNGGLTLATNTIIGNANLSDAAGWYNDHPIGFSYQSAITNGDSELIAKATALTVTNNGNTVELFDATGKGGPADAVWCSSCHDVHNTVPAGALALLKVNNAGSNLCLTCHNK